MRKDLVTVRNLDTGRVSKIRRALAEHPVFGARLEIVPPGTKKKVRLTDLVPSNPVVFDYGEDDHETAEEDE